MSEVEFERLLDAVRTAVAPVPGEDFMTFSARQPMSPAARPQTAANDNDMSWPLIPFPDGWYASC